MKNPAIPGLDIPVRTIYCIGRNFAEHARELNNKIPVSPIVFLKPLSTICYDNTLITLPALSKNVHYEAELIVAISKSGKNIPQFSAFDYVAGYGIGIDFTARDIQQKAKEKGQPWSIAKGFDQFAPISNFLKSKEVESPADLDIKLFVNGFIKQHANTSEMIFSVDYLISYLSTIFTLHTGDLIFTGTPSGVGKVEKGDQLEAMLENGIRTLTVKID
ncbi:MAG: fumarylacetoacetate hydrolase family protein [Balneolaceae bacterium]